MFSYYVSFLLGYFILSESTSKTIEGPDHEENPGCWCAPFIWPRGRTGTNVQVLIMHNEYKGPCPECEGPMSFIAPMDSDYCTSCESLVEVPNEA